MLSPLPSILVSLFPLLLLSNNTEMKASMKGDFPKGVVKRNKKVASAALIKGQWTDDEDRIEL